MRRGKQASESTRSDPRWAWVWLLILVCGSAVEPSAQAQAASPNGGQFYYRNQRGVRIPIQVPESKLSQIKELRLFVSSDRGKNWHSRSIKPTEKYFKFHAPADGEYWFTLAKVSKDGKMQPPDVRSVPPGLQVLIDTKAPSIDLKPQPLEDGRVGVSWNVQDAKLDLSSLKLETRGETDSVWREVGIAKLPEGRSQWPARAGEVYSARLSIRDKAGNVNTSHLELPRAPTRTSMVQTTSGSSPTEPAIPKLLPETGAAEGEPPVADFSKPAPRTLNLDGEFAVPPRPRSTVARRSAGPLDRVPAVTTSIPADRQGFRPVHARPAASRAGSETVFDPNVPRISPRARRPARATPPVASNAMPPDIIPAVRRVPIASTREPVIQTSARVERPKPAPQRIPLVNSTRFAVNYELRGVGPAGVGKVELYTTIDNGLTWKKYGEDIDRTPPFEVTLPGEGRYGLRVLVTSPAGYGAKPPKPRDPPHIIVEVDTTPPIAELYQPVPDPTANRDALLISWSARDAHIASQPVALYYAEYPEGPWIEIKTGLPATGQYSWRIGRGVPYQAYLRLVARDLGNNVSVADTPKPILVDLSRPEAQVIGIAILPTGGSSTR